MRKIALYENQRIGRFLFLFIGVIAIIAVMLISNNLVKALAQQERERMNIWANATQRLAQADADADFEFLLAIIEQNNSIPVMVADEDFHILQFRNFKLPDKHNPDELIFDNLSERNRQFLKGRLKATGGDTPLREMAGKNPHFIEVKVYDNISQYIYYEDSILLKRLSWYPYIQLGVMVILVGILYFAVIYTKRSEQNRVWVGLSKETAHQLGTPISSLMAWTEYLELTGADPEITQEIDKDVKRLSVIADRFSKIGSVPELNLEYLNDVLTTSLDYMKNRISGKVKIRMNLDPDDHGVMLSRPLFEWVMENLAKNAVDAMDGKGEIDITTGTDNKHAWIEVKDTGKGIARKNFKTVFNPGYTTKKRGWGLGLTLVKRIIEEYHGGKIYVKSSEPGQGTTFRIELPLC
ncbi:MAG: HAMP domain-containing histidine kinase [Muribaculaceae bacterium]|nr:HAMP domain-containing histidine kinase [Muribaculaceae bacterium]